MLVTCPECKKTLKIPDAAAGKRARCPSCLTIIDVPAEAAAPPAAGLSGAGSSTAAPRRGPPDAPAPRPSARTASAEPPRASPPNRPASSAPRTPTRPPDSSSSPGSPSQAATPRSRPRTRPPTRPPVTRPPAKQSREIEAYDDYDQDGSEAQVFQDESLGGGYFDSVDEYDENPFAAPRTRTEASRTSGRGQPENCRTAGTGLLIQGWATVAVVLTVLVLVLVGLTLDPSTAATRGPGAPSAFLVFAGFGGLVIILAAIGVLIGECMCINIPEKSGAKGLIIGAVCCLSIQVITSVFQQFAPNTGIIAGLALCGAVAALAHIILFELFLRAAARYVRRDDLVRQATIVLVGMPTCLVLVLAAALIGPLLQRAGGGLLIGIPMLILMLGSSIAMIVLAVMHVALLFRVGTALRN